MTTDTTASTAKEQARRLQAAVAHIRELVQRPHNAQRLRAAPGADEWTVLQTLGHCAEMIPYWLAQCRSLIDATGAAPPHVGRTLDDPARLAGPARGTVANPDALLAQLQAEAEQGAATIMALTSAERAKTGTHPRLGQMRVEDIVERFVVAHAEEHEQQIRTALQS